MDDATKTISLGMSHWQPPTQRILNAAIREGGLPSTCPPGLKPLIEYLQKRTLLPSEEISMDTDSLEQQALYYYGKLFPERLRPLFKTSARMALLTRLLVGLVEEQELDPICGFACGLFQNIGSLAIDMACYPNEGEKLKQLADVVQTGVVLHQAEISIFETDHGLVGAKLLERWGVPDWVCESLRYHTHPELVQKPYVSISELAESITISNGSVPQLSKHCLLQLGLTEERINHFMKAYKDFVPLAFFVRDLESGTLTSIPEIGLAS